MTVSTTKHKNTDILFIPFERYRNTGNKINTSTPGHITLEHNAAILYKKIMSSLRDYFNSFADEQKIERLKQCLEIERALYDCERIHNKVERYGTTDGNEKPKRNKLASLGSMFKRKPASTLSEDNLSTTKSENSTDTSGSPSTSTPSYRLQDSRAGMKMARFYDWGLSNPRAQEAVAAMRSDSAALHNLHANKDQPKGSGSSSANGAKYDTLISAAHLDASNTSCSREHHAVWGCRAMALGCATELVQLKKCFQTHPNNNPKYFAYDNNTGDEAMDGSTNGNDCKLDMQKLGTCVLANWKELDSRASNS